MNQNILRKIRKKRRLWKAYKSEQGPLPGARGKKDSESFHAFRKVQQEVQKAIKSARRKVEKKLAMNRKPNSKAFFSYLKKRLVTESVRGH